MELQYILTVSTDDDAIQADQVLHIIKINNALTRLLQDNLNVNKFYMQDGVKILDTNGNTFATIERITPADR